MPSTEKNYKCLKQSSNFTSPNFSKCTFLTKLFPSNIWCTIHLHFIIFLWKTMSYLGHFQEVPQAMPALSSSPQRSSETCQLPVLSTNYLLLAMSCSVSKEPLHLVMTTETLHHRVTGSNQPTDKPNSTIIHKRLPVCSLFHEQSISIQVRFQVLMVAIIRCLLGYCTV